MTEVWSRSRSATMRRPTRLAITHLLLALACCASHSISGQAPVAQDGGEWLKTRHTASAEEAPTTPQQAPGRLLQENTTQPGRLEWHQGILIMRTLSLNDGTDAVAHLLKRRNGRLLELVISKESLLGQYPPGTNITVRGNMKRPDLMLVVEMFPTIYAHQSKAFQTSGMVASLDATGVTGGWTWGASLTQAQQWKQTRVLGSMPTLVMVATMCGSPMAAEPAEVEKIFFDRKGSAALTLEGYFNECSRGRSYLNTSNSRVVGPVRIPCNYSSSTYSFSALTCGYDDSAGWHAYAQQYVKTVMGIDISKYSHKVLLMPRYYTMKANCPWIGQGTLGPDSVTQDGSYLSSKVWISGEYWNVVMAYMHELGHTNYLHHAMQSNCPYCDQSCLMGGCCNTRCFNAPHNWQLGWRTPIALVNSTTLQAGIWQTFVLPAQNMADASFLMIQPDWNQMYQFGRAYMWFVQFRTNSGKYDQQVPEDYAFQTNIYWWDGMYQIMPSMTRWMAAIYNNEEFRNNTDMLVIRQTDSHTEAAIVSICQISQFRERSCGDGLDNDCDGLIDDDDPDCSPDAAIAPPVHQVGDTTFNGLGFPPPPHPIRPPHPPSPPNPFSSPSPSPPYPPSPEPSTPPSPKPPHPKRPRPPPPYPPPSPVPVAGVKPKKSPVKKSPLKSPLKSPMKKQSPPAATRGLHQVTEVEYELTHAEVQSGVTAEAGHEALFQDISSPEHSKVEELVKVLPHSGGLDLVQRLEEQQRERRHVHEQARLVTWWEREHAVDWQGQHGKQSEDEV